MELNDKLKSAYNDLKSKAENLKSKLELDTKGAHDEFDTQTAKIKEWLDENHIDSDTFKHKSEEAKLSLKTLFEELQVQIALGKAEGKDSIKKHSKAIKDKIHNIKVEIDKDKHTSGFKQDAYNKLEEISDVVSILSTRFQHDIEESKELWDKKKKEIFKEIDSWSGDIENLKNISADKIDEISKEVNSVWKRIKKSF